MKKIYLTLASILLLSCGIGFAQTTVTFNYTGAMQTWVVPPCVTKVTVTVNGAQGAYGAGNGYPNWNVGGKGGGVTGVLNVVAGSTLNIFVGGMGGAGGPSWGGIGGWNGGGNGNYWTPFCCYWGGGGGGGSDIRVGGVAFANRVVVGGGGGAGGYNYFACCNYERGGDGGALIGAFGWAGNVQGGGGSGGGGTQAAGGVAGFWAGRCVANPGVLGIGGNTCQANGALANVGGGGGGGYYGGGAGCFGGGGGGSNYVGGLFSVSSNTQGTQAGNGIITITYVGGGAPLTLTTSFTNPSCGACNGSANVVPAGGSAPYTYNWNPGGQTNATATGLCAGTYTVIVDDICGDTQSATVTLTSAAIAVTANTTANETCNGNCVGVINSVVTVGGTPPYTYLWTPSGGTNPSATSLCAGTYTITVTDHAGCTATASATITQPAPVTGTFTSTGALCNGGSTGTATVIPAGGTPGYNYSWSTVPPQTNITATGLSAGTYTVTITDSKGCTGTASVTITQPPLLTANITAQTNVLCNGGTGNATITAGGGTPAYTYSWAPSGGSNAMGTGLTAGSYTVTVKDKNGCTATASVTITQPPLLTAAITAQTNASCSGGTGTATVTAAGGTPAYTYSWAPSGGSNAMGTGMSAGSYTVTVKDANGCTATASVTITQPGALSVTTTFTRATCNLPNGTATAFPAGGTPGYNYSWSTVPPQTNATATGLTAGTYTVTVTDANGCTASAPVTVTQPSAVTANITAVTNIACNGGTGSAVVTAGGGTPPYTYSWSPSGGSAAMATGLTAGSYTVTVSDNNGCVATASVTITQPPLLTATMGTPTDPACNGQFGSAMVTAAGGTLNYSYAWTPGGNTNANATNLTAGSYTVTVTDAHGCTATASVTITQPTLLTATITSQTNVLCNGGTGSATVTAGGGTPNYTYLWNPGANPNANATGLSAGSYTVTVKDANGCTATASVTITQPAILTANITASTNVPCNGGTGSATVTAAGGTLNYTYAWAPGGNTNANATGLTAGSYSVTVTDAHSCIATASVTITQPAVLTATMGAPNNVLCNGGAGSATVTAAGGTLNYTYLWTPSGGINATGTGLTAGSYTVTVTDAHGCTATASVTITQPTLLTATMGAPTNVACNGGTGSATVTAAGGTLNYTYAWAPTGGTNASATLTAGSYTVTVKDANGCTATASVTITQPAVLSTTATFTQATCNLPNGTATAHPAGGTTPYAYVWTPSAQTNVTATGLNAGSYTVTVTDAHGCTASAPVTVTQPSAVVASISRTTGVSCHGGNNGTATALATGGTAPYNYVWAPGGNTNATGTNLAAGTYTMTITDANGCTSTAAATITEPTTLVVTASGPSQVCKGSSGTYTANASGGTLPYNYLWSSGATTSIASITPVSPQTYTVTITDANSCTATAEVAVNFGPLLTVTANGQNAICTGASTTLCATAVGGTGGNTFLWSPSNQTTACITVSPSSTTTYTVTVTDNCGAQASADIPLKVNQLPTVDMNADLYTGCAPLCIQFRNASPNPSGGVIQYVWSFRTGDTMQTESPIYCYPNSGQYDVTLTVSDSAGCSATMKKSGMITIYSKPAASFAYSPQAISTLNPLVQFTDNSKDQYGIQAQWWNFGDGSETVTMENPSHTYQDSGTYCASLTVMNAHGCTDTSTNCLVITPAYTLYIPSAFSPNGDGVNDVFQPVGKYIKSFEMYIFDRWGMQLYHTNDITKGWKGDVKGDHNVAQEDSYVYKIIVTDDLGVAHSYVGNVSILK